MMDYYPGMGGSKEPCQDFIQDFRLGGGGGGEGKAVTCASLKHELLGGSGGTPSPPPKF